MKDGTLIATTKSGSVLGWQEQRTYQRPDGSRYTVATPIRAATDHKPAVLPEWMRTPTGA